MFPNLIEIKPLENFKLWLKFSDKTQGEVDLAHLANKGVFKIWSNYKNFMNVKIDDETGSIHWSENVELCPDSLYLKLIEKSFDEFSLVQKSNADN